MSAWIPVLGLRPWPVELPLPIAADATPAEAVAWLRERVVGVTELAGLMSRKTPRLYGAVGSEDVWLGVWLPGRLRARQSLFRGSLESGADGWQLRGSMRTSLNDQIRDVLLVVAAVGCVVAAMTGAIEYGPALGSAAVLAVVSTALRWLARKSRAHDLERMRGLLAAPSPPAR